ncbi:MAG: Helix-turn-helix domain [Streptosporangiaceae bacterium]|nr:Helix-turn-helix domain [Streptosporangiaceae bacterium]
MTTTHAPDRLVANRDAIREMRYAKGWNATELATKAGISQPYMSRIETGDSPGSPRALRLIADALGVPVTAITMRTPIAAA